MTEGLLYKRSFEKKNLSVAVNYSKLLFKKKLNALVVSLLR